MTINATVLTALGATAGLIGVLGGRWDARRNARNEQRDQLRKEIGDLERQLARATGERDVALDRLTAVTRALNEAQELNALLAAALGPAAEAMKAARSKGG